MHLSMFPHQEGQHQAGSGQSYWRGLVIVLLLAFVVIVLARTVFFVDETQYVYVTQFGQPLRLYTEAGLGIKWPYQSLRRFDRRLQIYEPAPREILTEDKENLEFEWFVCWRIPGESFVRERAAVLGDPLSENRVREEIKKSVERFLQSVGDIDAAERRLEERIQGRIAAEIGGTRLSQLVSLEPGQTALEGIGQRVTRFFREIAAEQFGIEVVDVRLKRFNYPEAVKPAVYAEIRSERERVAVQYRAEGASQKATIESSADLKRKELLAHAQRDATTIRGEGEAKAIEIFNEAHSKNPQFYEFLKTLETYRSILDDQTTLVLSADSPLLKLLTEGLPALKDQPARSPESEVPTNTKERAAGEAGDGT